VDFFDRKIRRLRPGSNPCILFYCGVIFLIKIPILSKF
jgi:hypothetical protein